jgi:hypothetical protein
MIQTKKTAGSHRRSTTKRRCKSDSTMHGLYDWYVSMFEKLGWMVLAKSRGNMEDKILSYKKSLQRLLEKLECKLSSVYENDRKDDIRIMHMNVKVLIEHSNRDL